METVTVRDIEIRIKDLELEKDKARMEYRYEWSEDYIQHLIDINKAVLKMMLSGSH